jgi:hypothetical protein
MLARLAGCWLRDPAIDYSLLFDQVGSKLNPWPALATNKPKRITHSKNTDMFVRPTFCRRLIHTF